MRQLSFIVVFAAATLQGNPASAGDAPIPPAKFTPAGHTVDKTDTILERLKAKRAVLVDVREKNEWDAGHLTGAKLVPLSALRANRLTTDMKKSLPKDKPIYVHCAAGGRVLAVSKILRKQGYDIRPLKDGYASLLKKGFKKAGQ